MKLDELNEPTPVDYAGTGFLMVDRSVFHTLKEKRPGLSHMEGNIGECYDYFDCGVSRDDLMEDRFYMSEDYAFCERCRTNGIKIMLDPSIRLGHVGRRVYR